MIIPSLQSVADANGPVETSVCIPGSGAQPSTRKYSCSCNRPARSPALNLSTAWTLSWPFALRQPGCSFAIATCPYPCPNLFPVNTRGQRGRQTLPQPQSLAPNRLPGNSWAANPSLDPLEGFYFQNFDTPSSSASPTSPNSLISPTLPISTASISSNYIIYTHI